MSFLRTLCALAGMGGGLAVAAEEAHWAYQPVFEGSVPAVRETTWPRGDLDRLVLARIEQAGLEPSPEASPGTLLRRVSLDLTGLPPTSEEAADFLRDASGDAYERAMERLLASPHFGERWAVPWLDAARYADTQGYEKDNFRTIWSYRDWVIDAFNNDLPFDRFTIGQLAGDLLPSPTERQLVATAFHRNTMTNTEGGASAEEFRVKAVIDRVNTTWQTWLGSTFACAQCHDHPHDPFTQREYYEFLAFFNNTEDANTPDDRPLLTLHPLARADEVAKLEGRMGSLPAGDALQRAELQRQLDEIPTTTTPIMRELPSGQTRATHLLHRGQWLEAGLPVTPGTPAALPSLRQDAPRDRLGMAQWIANPENPLTARVYVNRIWAQLFGDSLVLGDDFGSAAPRPEQAGLLDFLAWHFAHDWCWSTKRLLREIVLSATYRQTSRVTPQLAARDPQNRLLARASRLPLSAEMLRDQALAVSGLLSPKIHGRSVMPPQPEGTWQVVYNVQRWTPSRGEDLHRRSLYTFWRRTSPFPALALLGTPTREACVTQRGAATGPLSALVLLNDESFSEAARALGTRMAREAPGDTSAGLSFGYRSLVCESPSVASLATLQLVFDQARARLATDEAAYGVAAKTLLNTSAACTRE